ncbi:hypothetical protein CLD20_11115 [Afifella sp. IM 167]|nr:hypothetical protein [Afifella sp. IM 167]
MCAQPAFAGADEPAPWSERVVTRHLDYEALAGPLDKDRLEALISDGERLFTGKFTRADGAGRPMATQAIIPTRRKRAVETAFSRTGLDANSCSSCHHEPVAGGSGPFTANAFVSEGFDTPDFDSLDPQFSNERGTTHLFGAGLIELLAREMTGELKAQRSEGLRKARASGAPATVALSAKGVGFGKLTAAADGTVDLSGLEGIDTDLVVRPFSQKGVMTSLRQFSINAANQHHGMQAEERFGARWTGSGDFDEDGVSDELSPGDISALVAFQASLSPPGRKADLPPRWAEAAGRGESLFAQMGCAACHRPFLPLKSLAFTDPGPDDAAGTLRLGDVARPILLDLGVTQWARSLPRNAAGEVLVPLFGDLKRHIIADVGIDRLGNELLAQRFVERDAFMTAELWGVGSTAPYGHRGDILSLAEVIEAHGGEATDARKAWLAAGEEAREDVIAFLRSLVLQ